MLKYLFILFFPSVLFSQVTSTKFFIDGKYPGVIYKPSKATKTAVFFFHGDGEKGDGSDAVLTQKIIQSANHANLLINAEKYGFVVIAPQLVVSLQGWQPGWTRDYIRRYFEYAFKTFNIDTSYFYVTGLSRGGGGVWVSVCDPIWSKKIAAAVPICGTGEYSNDFLQPAINGVAVWAHHAKNDTQVGLVHSENQVRYINEKNPVIPARLTVYESGGHYIWGTVFSNDSVYKWMLSHKKGITVPPVTPPGKKIKYRIIVYDDGSVEIVPEGTTSTPVPSPVNKQELLAIRTDQIYDGSQARKTPQFLFDLDTTTVALGDYFYGYILEPTGGQIIYVVLDSFVNNARIEFFNGRWAYGGRVDFQWYYDIKDTSRKSPVYSTTLPSAEWRSIDAAWPDSSRLLKIRIADGGSINFSEVKVYASKLGPAPAFLPATVASVPDEGKYFQGYNKLSVDTTTDDAGWSQRNIFDMHYLDTFPNTNGKKIMFNRFGNSIQLTYMPAKRNGRKSHPTGAALRKAFMDPPHYTNDSKDMPHGADSTRLEAWQVVKNTYYGLAAKMGSNKNADIRDYTFYNTPPGVGLAVTEEIEVGNEDDARWAGPLRFHSALVKLQKLLAAYDGIKAADPSLKVISGAITGIDTGYLKAMYFTRRLLGWAYDPFDVIAVNEYCTNAGGQHSGTSDGVSPESFNLLEKLEGLIRVRDRYFPGKPVYITEIGYDVHDGSNYEVPVIAGQTREQTKAYWGLRCFEIGAAAKVSRMYWYTQEQSGGGDFGTTGFTKAVQRPDGSWGTDPVDLYWYMTCRSLTLENYKAWPEVLVNGGNTDTWLLAYEPAGGKYVLSFWSGTSNNTILSNISVKLKHGGRSATLITPTTGIKQGTRTALNISNGTVWVTVTECPQYIEVTI